MRPTWKEFLWKGLREDVVSFINGAGGDADVATSCPSHWKGKEPLISPKWVSRLGEWREAANPQLG